MISEMRELAENITEWLRTKVKDSGGKGAIFGLSGGLDSAVVAALCKRAFNSNCLAVIIPCYSEPADCQNAEMVAKSLQLPFRYVNLNEPFDNLLNALHAEEDGGENGLAKANIKPRLRMIVLYYLAALKHYRVIGTSNKSEYMIGYFTKHGDGAADLLPLADLCKAEVRELASCLGIPQPVIAKPPSGGLWPGQTDEEELGLSYAQIDSYLAGEKVDPEAESRIEELILKSAHKRVLPPVFIKN